MNHKADPVGTLADALAHAARLLEGQPRLAVEQAEEILKVVPGQPAALLLRALAKPSCLHFYENSRAVRTASSEQVRRPIFRDGVDQWRNFEPWLMPLKQALGTVLDAY
jgi:hypothetical protein